MLGLNMGLTIARPAPIVAAGAPAPFTANAVHFDGGTDSLQRGAGFTGAADSKQILMSWWFDLTGGDAALQRFMIDGNDGFISIYRNTSNQLDINFLSAAAADVWTVKTTDTYLAAGGWIHVLLALDAAAAKQQIYVNDAIPGLAAANTSDALVDLTKAEWMVGDRLAGSQSFVGDMAEFYFAAEFLDMTVVANRRKFIDAVGKPVDLGATGATPTGTQPLVFFSGPTVSWHENKGSGGGMTENGALTDAATSPSD